MTSPSLKTVLLSLALCLAGVTQLFAVSASPVLGEVIQPDGTKIKLRARGGPWMHWLEDENGYSVIKDGSRYVYAGLGKKGRLAPTAHLVGRDSPAARGLKKGVKPTSEAIDSARVASFVTDPEAAVLGMPAPPPPSLVADPATAKTLKNLVILCRFSDHGDDQIRPRAEYDKLFNGGDAAVAPSGSVRDYYTEASYGLITLESTVLAWVTLPHPEAYYANGRSGLNEPQEYDDKNKPIDPFPKNVQGMVEHALKLVDPLVNFADFDIDNDGRVDAIDIIHSGYGAENGGNPDRIWSVNWGLNFNEYRSPDTNANGVRVRVNAFHTEPALRGDSGTGITRIGVICHETAHFLGMPDLYDSDSSSHGIGNYCLMANSWGFDQSGLYPPLPSAWCRIQLGWVSPTVVSGGVHSVPRVFDNKTIFKVTTGYPAKEYLLIENRQAAGFDRDIPQGGLAIWHIDEEVGDNKSEGYPGQAGWPGNGKHYKVALLQADGAYDMEKNTNKGDAGDLYRSAGVAAITPTTTPNTGRYQGTTAPSNTSVTNISASGSTMSFAISNSAYPAITSPLAASGPVGSLFSYQITAANSPTSFAMEILSGNATGLACDSQTGLISGVPLTAGTIMAVVEATNATGSAHSSLTLSISAGALVVSAPTATNVGPGSARLGGTVAGDGTPITGRGVVYSMTSYNSSPVIGGIHTQQAASSETTDVFAVNVSGTLTDSTQYSFRGYAAYAGGVAYSPVGTFTTLAHAVPTVTTPTFSTTSSAVILGGNVTHVGSDELKERGVCYALTSVNANPLPGSGSAIRVTTATAGGTGAFTVPLSGLVGGAQYSFRAYAQNTTGWGVSPVRTFTMPAAPPGVTFTSVTGITGSSATIKGRVTQDNGSPVTDYGALLAPSSYVGTLERGASGVREYSGWPDGTGGFTVVPYEPLQSGTSYRLRLFATNSGGTGYADTGGFNTPSNNASLSALTVTGGTLTSPFSSDQTTYYCNVPLASSALYIQPVKAHALSRIRVNGQEVTSGSTRGPFASGIVAVEVTAEDGTVRIYNIYLQSPSLAWTYTSETDVPLTANGYSANGEVSLSLGFAPSTGTTLMVVNNTSIGPSVGPVGGSGLYHGKIIDMLYHNIGYRFVVNMYGGDGNDVVLQWGRVRAVTWGRNDQMQLGDTTTTTRGSPIPVNQSGVLANKTIMALEAGGNHSLALCTDRTVVAWGLNSSGELGYGSNAQSLVPVEVVGWGALQYNAVAIAAGYQHSLALRSDGKVVAWGSNSGGQLGNGTTTSSNVPVLVNTSSGALAGKTVVAIAAGTGHSLALTSEGNLVMWGMFEGWPTTSLPATIDSSGTIRRIWTSGGQIFASRANGTLSCWGWNQYGQLGLGYTSSSTSSGTHGTPGGQSYPLMAPGANHALMVSQTGSTRTLKAFGQNASGKLGNQTSQDSSVPVNVFTDAVLAGRTIQTLAVTQDGSMALCTDGRLALWGDIIGNTSADTPRRSTDFFQLPAGEKFISASGNADGRHYLHLVALPTPMPTATTLAAGAISATSAELGGLVVPNGAYPIITFEYGATTSYGGTASGPVVDNPWNNINVAAVLTGLQPDTTYHYRIVASGVAGADMTFTTRSLASPTLAGSVDATFNPGAYLQISHSIPLSDGRMLVGGSTTLKRLNVDGSVDSSFAPTIEGINRMALQPDGKILVGGWFSTVNGVSRRFLARLDAAGNLDSSTAFAPPSAIDNGVYDLLVLPDGKIMVCGQFSGGIMRLHPDGTKDTSFTAVANNIVYAMLLQPDGKLLIGGSFTTVGGGNRAGVARFNSDGTLESTATFNVGTGVNSLKTMILQADNKIVIAGGFSHVNDQLRPRIARLNSDGSLESTSTFNVSMDSSVESLALQADGRIVAAGTFTTCNGVPTKSVVRIKSNGALDAGAEFERGAPDNGAVYSVSLKADGKVMLGGSITRFNNTTRSGAVVLHNDPAISILTVPDTARILWTRGGSAPEFERVTFELSTNGGSSWSALGNGTRVGTTANWQLAGLSLPTTAQLRGRGWVGGALLDTVVPYTAQPYVALATLPPPTHTSVSALGATLGGIITNDGGSIITDRGVVYAPTAVSNVPALDASGVIMLAAGETSTFTVSTQPLTPGTSYSYRAYAINSAGTSYSSVGTFTTPYNDASLGGLVLVDPVGPHGPDFAALSPAFHSGTTGYTATVPGSLASVQVGVILSQANATVRVNGVDLAGVSTSSAAYSTPLALHVGPNTLTTEVTAQDGTVKTYTVTVTKTGLPVLAAPASGQIATTSAMLGASITSTGFAPIMERGAVISPTAINATPRLDGVGVIKLTNVTLFNDRYEMSVTGLTPGVGYSFACFATNSEGTSYTSTLTFTTISNDARLSTLALSAGTLTPVFSSATTAYQVTVPNTSALFTVTPTTAHAAATVRVNNVPVTSGSASQAIPLQVGFNTVTFNLTAQDGSTTKAYVLTVTRQSVAADAVETWAVANGLPPSAAAPMADADGDGVPNLMEFAFGTSPSTNSRAPMQFNGGFAEGVTMTQTGQPAVAHESTPTGTDFRAVFVRRVDHATVGLTYTVRFSADMVTWQTSVVTPTVLGTDGTHQAVSVPYPPFINGKKARFFTVGVDTVP